MTRVNSLVCTVFVFRARGLGLATLNQKPQIPKPSTQVYGLGLTVQVKGLWLPVTFKVHKPCLEGLRAYRTTRLGELDKQYYYWVAVKELIVIMYVI